MMYREAADLVTLRFLPDDRQAVIKQEKTAKQMSS